jgi:hypothetical protein
MTRFKIQLNQLPQCYWKILVIASLLSFALPNGAHACSMVACVDKGIEMRKGFDVKVVHGRNPLSGVSVQIISGMGQEEHVYFSGKTEKNGNVQIRNLAPRVYWIRVELLGVLAGLHCFHVRSEPTRKAKKQLMYSWGELAPAVSRAAGLLVDIQLGDGENWFQKFRNRQAVPISGAMLKLQDPFSQRAYYATTDENGAFTFDRVPHGRYVLHVEGGNAGSRKYDSTDQLIYISSDAQRDKIILKRTEAGGGDCGGTVLDLTNAIN